jgi:hypothetical protein
MTDVRTCDVEVIAGIGVIRVSLIVFATARLCPFLEFVCLRLDAERIARLSGPFICCDRLELDSGMKDAGTVLPVRCFSLEVEHLLSLGIGIWTPSKRTVTECNWIEKLRVLKFD